MKSHETSVAAPKSQSGTPSAHRLLIRIEITREGAVPASDRRRLSRGALLLILGAVALLLSWVGITKFRTDPASAPAATEAAPTPESQSPSQSPAPVPVPNETAQLEPDAPPSPINEVVPNVPLSARNTIRGTIKVSVRVTIDKAGTVLVATADVRGPSRYFERLATEASKQWTFTPASSDKERIMLVIFNFTRAGTVARASSLQ